MLRRILASPDDAASLVGSYTNCCHGHILRGQPMTGARPQVLGRAASPRQFYELLVRLGHFNSFDAARAAFRRWLRQRDNHTKPRVRALPLGRYLMWATYSMADRTRNPFEAMPANADEIRDLLGLGPPDRHDHSLLLFVYVPPAGLDLRFPTIADAERHHYFRPALMGPGVEAGLTCPTRADLTPQPELVHQPVFGDTLCGPIKRQLP